MDYQKIYNQLIDRAHDRILSDDIYTEKHHIIPRSHGGSNEKSNLAILTGREHLIAHMLLWKIHNDKSMTYAFWTMANRNGIRINSRMYSTVRSQHAINVSVNMTNKVVKQSTRDLISKARTGVAAKPKGYKHNMSEEEKTRRSNRKGKGLGNPGFIGNHTAESKAKMCAKKANHPPTNYKRVSANSVIFNSAVEASKSLGVTYNWLMRRIKLSKYPDYFYIEDNSLHSLAKLE